MAESQRLREAIFHTIEQTSNDLRYGDPLDFIDGRRRCITVNTLIIVVRCCRVAAERDDLKFLDLAHRIAVPRDHWRRMLHEAVSGLLAHHLLL